ncbi:MAG: M56 family metallopeptidase, partial [Verrucomicrobiota bacterium]
MTPLDGRQLVTGSLPVAEASSGLKMAAPDISLPASGPVASGKVSPKSAGYPLLWLPGLWLAGILILGGVVAIQMIRFHLKLVRDSAPVGRDLQELFAKCRREFPVSRRIELLETGAVQSPALYGLFRLRFLLPRGLGGQFENRELRYIFFHELAHVQRGDLWLNWLVTGLQMIHWFNPLLWFGFARLRADRELACDELALLRAGDQAGIAYGETVVKLLEKLNQPAAIPGLVGILEDRKQMRQRISMIANFRKPSRWSVLAVFLLAAVATAALTDAQSPPSASQPIRASVMGGTRATGAMDMGFSSYLTQENSPLDVPIVTNTEVRPDLTGQVLAGNGAPLPVSATVFIATAAPKTGSSTFCPSCYADCAKHATTDAAGNFKITSLDPQLKFQILAVAKGFKPQYVNHVDPANGPKKIKLEPIESTDALPDRSLRGRVVDSRGAPIAGAVVEMRGIENHDGSGGWGLLPDIDPLAVADENGEFIITAKKPFDMLDIKVTARAFADKLFNKLASGGAQHELTLTEGATLTGRVLSAGKPLAGVSVGISAVDRTSPNYLGHFEVGTDAHGRFVFVNLPPAANFEIYTLMGTMKSSGAVPQQQIHTGRDGETTDTGDLIAAPSHRLSGWVVLMDGQPLPAKTRLLISRDAAWDSMQVTPDQDGKFEATGIPPEVISLSARVKGYHVSERNLSVDQINPYRLIGRVDRDITNLVFMLEKGPDPAPDYSHVDPDYNELRQRTLRGAEGVADHSHEWSVAGHAFDGDTKQPIQNFHVTPGDTGNFNQPAWNTFHTVAGAGGAYQIYIGKRMAQPVLLAEADGYLPAVATVLPEDSTNVDFALRRGEGPAGTVVTPEGKPAAGATVVLLNDDFNE